MIFAQVWHRRPGPSTSRPTTRAVAGGGDAQGQRGEQTAQGHIDKLPALAAELVRLKVDVILTASTPTAQALQHVTSTIPIVMAIVADPVGSGLVESLGAREGKSPGTR